MNQVQKNLLDLLVEFDELCSSHNIEFFLGGGSALGAVRHRGFLNWDDDVDLYMTRPNWDKLRSIADQIMPDGRALIHLDNTPYYCNVIPRYVNQETSQFYKSQVICGLSCGQHIEVLIMDPLPTDEEEIIRYKKLLLIYTELLTPYFVVNRQVIRPDSLFDYQLYKKYYRRSRIHGREKVLRELEDRLFHYSDEECTAYCMRWGITLLQYAKSSYGSPRYELFEGHRLPVAEHAEEIFRVAYGDDWMYIPPSGEQVVHHAIRDYDTPLQVYYQDYIPYIDRDKALHAYKKNKKINLRILRSKEQTNKNINQMRAIVDHQELTAELQPRRAELKKLFDEKKYDELKEIFGRFYQCQLAGTYRRNGILLLDDPELICIAAAVMARTGEYFKAQKILNVAAAAGMETTEDMRQLTEMISLLRELSIAQYDHKDTEAVSSLLAEGQVKYGPMPDFFRVRLWLLEADRDLPVDWNVVRQEAEKALAAYPNDPECLKYLADALWESGEKEKAEEYYYQLMAETRNGIILLDIKDRTGLVPVTEDELNDDEGFTE